MLLSLAAPALTTILLIALATIGGIPSVQKLISVFEAKHELKQGSSGFLRTVAGWSIVAFWLMTTWFAATIIGDWAVSGDFEGAVGRSWLRLRVLLEIAMAVMAADN